MSAYDDETAEPWCPVPPRPILDVAEEVISQLRANPRMDAAIDAYAPGRENAHVRWLSRTRGYEVTIRFDADVLDGRAP